MAKFYYGGQAVMEGVMMRGRHSAAVAVRQPDGNISVYEEVLNSKLYRSKLFRLPFLRGVLLLWEMLVLGTRMMTLSANIASGAINPEKDFASVQDDVTPGEDGVASTEEEKPIKIGGATLVVTLLFSLTFAIALFFVGPLLLANLFRSQLHEGWLS